MTKMIVWTALGISLLYLPFLWTGFDFADDGVLVYPNGVHSPADFFEVVRTRTIDDFESRGPLRPSAWAFWMGQAELFQGNPFLWRLARHGWIILSSALLLLFMKELGIGFEPALLATIFAMWNPYRIEIWLGLNFMEGTLMPFALGGLICAIRASQAERPWGWDLCGFACVLLAVMGKNVFLAMIPAQLFLRVATPRWPFGEGLRKHARRALVLGLAGFFPVVHFILYKMNYRPGQYEVGWDAHQPWRLLRNMGVGLAIDFLAPVLILGAWLIGRTLGERRGVSSPVSVSMPMRNAWVAGLLLFLAGYAVYLPVMGAAARYVVPGIWGLDVLLALFFSRLAQVPSSSWQRVTYGLLGCALVALALVNLGKQTKFKARNDLLWDALTALEKQGSSPGPVGWFSVDYARKTSDLLEFGEGYHFAKHLMARGWVDLDFRFVDAGDGEQKAPFGSELVLPGNSRPPVRYLLTGTTPPPDSSWVLMESFQRPYWAGLRNYQCFLWKKADAEAWTRGETFRDDKRN